ncbi:MAG: class I SAM-dependent methyltransferase [Chloroflexota bacterium]|nr:class I SAM-dependent methyltransferase [Chloroflexota bacterium]
MSESNANHAKDYLWLHVRSLPYFRSLLRAVEARFYQGIELPAPTLDLGCGDGHFASIAFDRKLEVGLDPWGASLREAATWSGYQSLVQAEGSQIPFTNGYFNSAVSNSVLEHIPDIDAVLIETQRVLKPGAPFIFCVPNHQLLPELSIARLFDGIRIHKLANAYRNFFNRIARHYHADPPEIWEERLTRTGFQIDSWWHYFSPQATALMEWGHYFGLPSLISRWLTGHWILVPERWNLGITYRLVKPYYDQDPVMDSGTYTFFIARRSE